MLSDRGVEVDHTTLFRWVQTHAATPEQRVLVEQDHRRTKWLVRPGPGFGSLRTARRRLAGYEVMTMISKGQVHGIGGRDMPAQAAFIATLLDVAA